jgi:uncharacterized membrane protein YqaE (UPF0057 family)
MTDSEIILMLMVAIVGYIAGLLTAVYIIHKAEKDGTAAGKYP